MAQGIIELNDAAINLGVDGKLTHTSSGYAVLDGERLLIGEQGQQHFKLLPRWVNHRFWDQLSTDPLPNGTNTLRHLADLAFSQLEQLWQPISTIVDELVIAVPGHYNRSQLSLLLGMTKEAKMPIVGLVDLGLAAVAQQPCRKTALFLDISLHRITLTRLQTDGMLRVTSTQTIIETGLFTLWDQWANLIAEQFIQSSRYDPMHEAQSEQCLFDLLPTWIRATHHEGTNHEFTRVFNLEVNNSKYSTNLSQDQLMQACTSIYPTIVQAIRQQISTSEITSLFVANRFAGFPALKDSLNLIPNLEMNFLSPLVVIETADSLWGNLTPNKSAISHVTTLPLSKVVTPKADDLLPPSHILVGHRAYSLHQARRVSALAADKLIEAATSPIMTLYRQGAKTIVDIHSAGITINDQSAMGECLLSSGDQIAVNGHTATLITEH